ncbi:MAG: lysylphosphatidylglycerol synthase transmembrane domain-containing protein [Candidatus Sumerlaeaceae bacterium]
MHSHIIKRIVWFCVLVVLLYAFWVIATNYRNNVATLRDFPWRRIPLILAAVTMNFLIRELKWTYFCRVAGIQAPRLGHFLIYFSGLSMTISPGRVGELIKPFMYKEYFGNKMRRTVPLVFCERVSDLLGMIIVAALTIAMYMHGAARAGHSHGTMTRLIYGFLVLSFIFTIILLYVARHRRLVYRLIRWMTRHEKLRRTGKKIQTLYFSTYPLLTVKNLAFTTLLAAISWSFECVALMMILHGTNATAVTLGESAFVFCMATIFGGFLFFAPGGLGGFEGSAKVMLTLLGLTDAQIVPAVLITRFCTLFYSVVIGFVFILLTSLKYHKRMQWEEFEHARETTD